MKIKGNIDKAKGRYIWLTLYAGNEVVATVNLGDHKNLTIAEHRHNITALVDNRAIYTVDELTVRNENGTEVCTYTPPFPRAELR